MDCMMREKLFAVLDSLMDEQKKPKDYGGYMLYHAEVRFLETTSKQPNANTSELAKLLGITKSAVTQSAAKLAAKDLIEIYTLTGNKKEKHFRLTEQGIIVRQKHMEFHRETNRRLCEYFCTLDLEKGEAILEFLDKLKECMPFCVCDCSKSSDITAVSSQRETKSSEFDNI